MTTLIQIGANVGPTRSDPIWNTLNKYDNVILIEPVEYLYAELVKNCSITYPNNKFIILNVAISDKDGEEIMTIPSKTNFGPGITGRGTQWSSFHKNVLNTNKGGLKLELEDVPVKTMTINTIIKEYDIKRIDLLAVDTEGHDFIILMNYDFSIKPKSLIFERLHLNGPHRPDGPNTNMLHKKLTSLDYTLVKNDKENSYYEYDPNKKLVGHHSKNRIVTYKNRKLLIKN